MRETPSPSGGRLLRLFVEEDDAIARACAVLAEGGIVAYPTETFYGLGADPFNPRAVERLLAVKGRPAGSPLPLIAGSTSDVARLFPGWDARARELAEAFWPGPLTLALAPPVGIHTACVSERGTTGVRVPGGAHAKRLAAVFGGLLTATSANLSGRPPASTPLELGEELAGRIDALLDGGRTPGGLPSTVLDLSGPVYLLAREGAVPAIDIETVTGVAVMSVKPL